MDTMTYPEYVALTFKKTRARKPGEVQKTVDSLLRGLCSYRDAPRIFTIDDDGQATLVRKTTSEWFELTMDVVLRRVSESIKA